MVTDALGDPIKLETVKEARDGEDVQLTLDPVIQQKAEQVLSKIGETYSPQGATAIVDRPAKPRKSWRWRTGRRSIPATSNTSPTKTC